MVPTITSEETMLTKNETSPKQIDGDPQLLYQKSAPVEIHVKAAQRIVEGYASAFHVLDSYGDVVVPGAFEATIAQRQSRGLVKFLWQHDRMKPIGRIDDLREDSKGLLFRAYVARTPLGDEALELMSSRAVDRTSIGYSTLKQTIGTAEELGIEGIDPAREVRRLDVVKLYEISAVTFAANEDARIAAVKAGGIWVPISDDVTVGSIVAAGDVAAEVVEVCAKGVVDGIEAKAGDPVLVCKRVLDGGRISIRRSDVDSPDVLRRPITVTTKTEGAPAAPTEGDQPKAGRVLSAKNLASLKSARDAISAVIAQAESDDEGDDGKASNEPAAPSGVDAPKAGPENDSILADLMRGLAASLPTE